MRLFSTVSGGASQEPERHAKAREARRHDAGRGEVASGALDLESLADLHTSFQTALNVAQAYADVGEASRAAEHLERAFAMDPSCARTVAAAPSFQVVRQAPEVTAALATYGVR